MHGYNRRIPTDSIFEDGFVVQERLRVLGLMHPLALGRKVLHMAAKKYEHTDARNTGIGDDLFRRLVPVRDRAAEVIEQRHLDVGNSRGVLSLAAPEPDSLVFELHSFRNCSVPFGLVVYDPRRHPVQGDVVRVSTHGRLRAQNDAGKTARHLIL